MNIIQLSPIYILLKMQKQVILIMDKDYPFGQYEDAANKKSKMSVKTLVRKIHETQSLQERNQILEKINILRSIDMKQVIKIQTVLEEESSIHLLYEYVPVKLIKWIRNIDDDFIKSVKEDILNLGIQLAQVGIFLNWNINNLGLDQNSHAKYYLDIDQLEVEKEYDPKSLRKLHLANLNTMFEPFLFSSFQNNDLQHEFEKNPNLSQAKVRKRSSAPSNDDIDAFYKNQNFLLKQTEENIEKRKKSMAQKKSKKASTNWKQLQQDDQILRDFINVLDDDKSEDQPHETPFEASFEEQQEEVIWNQSPQNDVEEEVWVDCNEIKRRATQAIKRSREVMTVFRNIMSEKKK